MFLVAMKFLLTKGDLWLKIDGLQMNGRMSVKQVGEQNGIKTKKIIYVGIRYRRTSR